jgi:hypothetical protein
MSDNACIATSTAFISLALAGVVFFITECHSKEFGYEREKEKVMAEGQTKVQIQGIELQKVQATQKENWEITPKK